VRRNLLQCGKNTGEDSAESYRWSQILNRSRALRTSDRREAERLLNAMNESHREPTLNLNLARAYLAAHDPKMAQRTWQAVMDEMATHGKETGSTQWSS